jgi:5'-nucleotidase
MRSSCSPWAVLAAAAVVSVAGCTSQDGPALQAATSSTPAAVEKPLSILMVNDDGWDAPGITAAYDALVADGHRVTLVAPLVNQSGRSMATGSDPLVVSRPAGKEPKYAVDGTPVDSLNVGLRGVLKNDPPDVVVSGVNTGANVAGNTSYSGTVGAAAAAAEQGLPALAVSADVGGPDGTGDYDDAAAIVVDLVDELAATGFEGLGRDGFVNVNVPFETEDRSAPRGMVVAPLAPGAPRTVEYSETEPGTWTPTFAYDARVGGRTSDAERLADGWTTLTFLPVARVEVGAGQQRLDELFGKR